MTITDAPSVTTDDIEIYRHGDRPMIIRLIRPVGAGPFPAILDMHGGCWCKGGPDECSARGEVFAEAGMASAALDFRQAADIYPSSLEDINYALRWLKAHAEELRLDAGRIGILGQSSGGHLAMLAAMRPNEPRYAALPLEPGAPDVDASVRCVGMMWPVINPLSRYRRVVGLRAAGDPPAWVADLPERHDTYWVTEKNMEEANPMLALERGEAVEILPAIWFQGTPDPVHDYRDPESPLDLNEPERFAENYRKAGGTIEIAHVEQGNRSDPALLGPLVEFFQQNLA
ncbi:MAG: alpha/beta hydrolase [Rhodospirillaceae bacterium]|jgi:acetyl esterase/lipase|nr:alpha/beta hydrolase [Rhodospirillaceae bacterium]MBT6403264.1 alpha/beta hydrolase [Rhodospirillaceae bacterium]MBT6534935.1 alpha/beta hydrolase [Rhodospirillaceae bacterium]